MPFCIDHSVINFLHLLNFFISYYTCFLNAGIFWQAEKLCCDIDIFGLILSVYEVDHVVALMDLVHSRVEYGTFTI